jgi:hypothetical protein
MRKGKDPDPDPGEPKTCGSGSPTLSTLLRESVLKIYRFGFSES